LDAALRRRFAFIERMPDTEPLLGATINGVALGELLEALNKRVRARDGREKQFGHAFFLNGTRPITTSDELARRLRHEVLPLLQEYCHDDYAALAAYLGKDIVDVEAQALDESRARPARRPARAARQGAARQGLGRWRMSQAPQIAELVGVGARRSSTART
jgi:5-methylcytosine-specific restriction protein B